MKKIGIGYEFFKDFTKEKMYYVDKTMLIKELLSAPFSSLNMTVTVMP